MRVYQLFTYCWISPPRWGWIGLQEGLHSVVVPVFQQDIEKPHGIAQVRRISWVRGVGRPDVVSGLLVKSHDRSATLSADFAKTSSKTTKKAPSGALIISVCETNAI